MLLFNIRNYLPELSNIQGNLTNEVNNFDIK